MITDPIRSKLHAGAAELTAKHERRYYLRAGNMWLHWSATKLTGKRCEAWSGTIEQARNCRRDKPAAAGCKAIPINSIVPVALKEDV